MWRYIHDESGATLWVNQEQVVKIEALPEDYAILYMADGTRIVTDEEYEQFLKDGAILK